MILIAESGWVLALSLATKLKSGDGADSSILFDLTVLALSIFFATAILHWAATGGPAWGSYRWSHQTTTPTKPIPGPRGLPIIGSMSLMTGLAHRKLAAVAAASDASRLMAFSLGGTRVVVTCNPDVAKEILCSSAFADRPVKESAYRLMFHRAIGFAPYGTYWRVLRRIASTHLFCPKQIAASAAQRAEIVAQMVEALARTSRVRDVLKQGSLHNVMWSVFGRRYELGGGSEEMMELRSLVDEGYQLLGKLNWSDHVPLLARLDPQGIRSRCATLVPRVVKFVGRIIKEHRLGSVEDKVRASDFVDVLLSLQGSDKLSDSDMITVLWEMIFRGTDTVAVLTEWALARLVRHRNIQNRVHEELDRVVGRSRAVSETDAVSLPYLDAVIKEVLRLHPPGPLLSWARLATSDIHIDGHLIPAGTTAMVNMWAITHDATLWEAPSEFRPERFLAGGAAANVSVSGSDLSLAPFGSGRRSCPGKPLAMATVTYWLATLLHEYHWMVAGDGTRVDFSEVLGLSCEMAVPLEVKLVARRR